jgi:hypothetical protein
MCVRLLKQELAANQGKFRDYSVLNPDYVYRVKPERKLEQEHKDFLLSTDTMNAWAGFTVKDRCALFRA